VELYLHSLIRLYGVVFNSAQDTSSCHGTYFSTGTNLPVLPYSSMNLGMNVVTLKVTLFPLSFNFDWLLWEYFGEIRTIVIRSKNAV